MTGSVLTMSKVEDSKSDIRTWNEKVANTIDPIKALPANAGAASLRAAKSIGTEIYSNDGNR